MQEQVLSDTIAMLLELVKGYIEIFQDLSGCFWIANDVAKVSIWYQTRGKRQCVLKLSTHPEHLVIFPLTRQLKGTIFLHHVHHVPFPSCCRCYAWKDRDGYIHNFLSLLLSITISPKASCSFFSATVSK
jgi:hypothetical protein